MELIRSKNDCRNLIPRPTMGRSVQHIRCLDWSITRTCQDLVLRTSMDARLVDEDTLVDMIWAKRKRINDDRRLAYR